MPPACGWLRSIHHPTHGLKSPCQCDILHPPHHQHQPAPAFVHVSTTNVSSRPFSSFVYSDCTYVRFSPLMGKMHHHQSSDSDRPKPNKASLSQPFQDFFAKALPRDRDHRDRDRGNSSAQPAPSPSPSPTSSPAQPPSRPLASENSNPTNSNPTHSNPTPTPTTSSQQPPAHDPSRPVRARVPAVTSKAMTTAPVKDKSRPPRRKYPT